MTSDQAAVVTFGWLALALGSGLLADGRKRRLAAGGLACLGLGLAAWRATSTYPGGALASADHLVTGFLVVNGGLLLLGLTLVVWAVGSAGLGGRGAVALPAAGLGAILIARISAGPVFAAGLGRVAASALALGLAGVALLVAGRWAASTGLGRALGPRLFSAPLQPSWNETPGARRLAALMAASTAATALGPHVAVVFLGVIMTAWSGFFLFGPGVGTRMGRVPLAPLLSLLLLPGYWLLATVAGPEGLSIAALPLVPLSPAAESLIAPALLLAGWSAAGLWPLHRQLPGAFTGPAGALLLSRIALPLAAGALEHWRPVVVPLVILGMWHAAARARWPLLAVGGALLGIAGVTPSGATGAGWLIGSALILELSRMRSFSEGVARLARVVGWISGAWGGLLVLEGGLHGEVVYTTLGTVGLALLVVSRPRQAMIASAPRTPSPRA
jgi:hypothetical protein